MAMIRPIRKFFCKDNESPGEMAGCHYYGRKNSHIFVDSLSGRADESRLQTLNRLLYG